MTDRDESFSLAGLARRLHRVLALLETYMKERVGARYDTRFFDGCEAFLWSADRLEPVDEPAHFDLADLVGIDSAVQKLTRNTEQFVRGLPYNHVLLHGERGTGKSSAVRGLLARYAKQGLRLVEVQRADLLHLPRILSGLSSASPELRFLLFCDDLSFGADESGYRELKAVLDGSIRTPQRNVLLVITSNRRHLLPESMADNRQVRLDAEGDIRLGEAIDEKLALSERFGLVLGFYPFDQNTYLAIVDHYLQQSGLGIPLAELRDEALRWALDRNSRSGRVARQFVDDWVGRHLLELERGRR